MEPREVRYCPERGPGNLWGLLGSPKPQGAVLRVQHERQTLMALQTELLLTLRDPQGHKVAAPKG